MKRTMNLKNLRVITFAPEAAAWYPERLIGAKVRTAKGKTGIVLDAGATRAIIETQRPGA